MFLASMCVRKRSAKAAFAWSWAHHLRLLDNENGARPHCQRRRHPLRLAGKAPFAEEMANVNQRNHRLFSRVRQDRQPDRALLDVHDARGWIALREDLYCRRVLDAMQPYARPINRLERFERSWGFRFPHHACLRRAVRPRAWILRQAACASSL